jgi:hypothetical protein
MAHIAKIYAKHCKLPLIMPQVIVGKVNTLALVVIGCGIGWFVGMSASPVVNVLVASIVTAAVGVSAAIAESQARSQTTTARLGLASAVPLALVTVGAVAGSMVGIYVRTHDLMSPKESASAPAPKLTQAARAEDPTPNFVDATRSVLFNGVPADECVKLRAEKVKGNLRYAMQRSSNERVQAFAERVKEESVLNIVLQELVCPE